MWGVGGTQRRPACCVTEVLYFQIKGSLVEDSVPSRQGPYLCPVTPLTA